MKTEEKPDVLRIENLHTYFYTREGVVKAVNGVSLSVKEDSVLGVVGESGAGKSVMALSLLRLVPHPGRTVEGGVYFQGRDLLKIGDEELLRVRGKDIAMIFQDARGSLNPIETIGDQIMEILLAHSLMSIRDARELAETEGILSSPRLASGTMSHVEARARTMDLLRELELPEPIFKQYPHQLSGGMAQRAMIAMATAWQPKVLIADEPTSNLDMTIQADVLARLKRIRAEKHSTMIIITHNMGVIAQVAKEVAVMYAGMVVEYADTPSLFQRPYHPYTWALLQTIPRLDEPKRSLRSIRGTTPDPIDLPDLCPFLPRCPKATNVCRLSPQPPLREIEPGHSVACYNEITYG
ncbi:MAG: Peptide/nickel transport system ATP-binding protein [Dehalococcoidia bacterium]|nr:Peptide/nickel transport system ATP-binding protein [Dehalococcoidia bacterium]